ncbi:MAG: NADH-quinone oxidoreductase subunit J [Melioribacteraceae bacterium]|nr:NADH-quinone oxidoreductase subunit J [Melioribacteraceae bacterium]MCF8412293.1 NADH-quinone oxidoreductase subunit J [Melioribacteraceae bacterium]MCF8432517.1 NADH-quinone oxidoreductase subunit J [Melioribacteraceae bacterium]
MESYTIIFYLFAAITLVSGFMVVTSKNIVHSAFYLLFTLFGISGIYALLGADFIAIVQVLVYIGGILILILFGVMLTNKITSIDIKSGSIQTIPAIIGIGLFAGALFATMITGNWRVNPGEIPNSTIKQLGSALITDYVLVFELLGILLLIALIGAASIARRDKEEV